MGPIAKFHMIVSGFFQENALEGTSYRKYLHWPVNGPGEEITGLFLGETDYAGSGGLDVKGR